MEEGSSFQSFCGHIRSLDDFRLYDLERPRVLNHHREAQVGEILKKGSGQVDRRGGGYLLDIGNN